MIDHTAALAIQASKMLVAFFTLLKETDRSRLKPTNPYASSTLVGSLDLELDYSFFVCLNHINVPDQHMQAILGKTEAC